MKKYSTIVFFALSILSSTPPVLAVSIQTPCKASFIEADNKLYEFGATSPRREFSEASMNYRNSLPNRPRIATIVLDVNSSAFMVKEKEQRTIAQIIINNCPDVGAVVFALDQSENDRVLGVLRGSNKVRSFPCGQGAGKPKWGTRFCGE